MRYFVELRYKGTNYHGWQIQPNAITVQESLEIAFSTILREKINIVGAGRTDTGVHAEFYIAHFNTNKEIEYIEKLIFRINRFLDYDISIQKIYKVQDDLHARFAAKSRTYKYRITTKKNPFTKDTATYIFKDLDIKKMNDAAKLLFNYSDFTSFSKLHTDTKTNICKIFHAEWTKKNDIITFTIKADRFLRNMVRAIVGTLLEIGYGNKNIYDFKEIIESKNRNNAGTSVPAQGLSLFFIEY